MHAFSVRRARVIAGLAVGLTVLSAFHGVARDPALLLFGGTNNTTFLGCLNCSPYATESVCNEYGPHGSPYAAESVWNPYGSFGSKYSGESPWNPYASAAPIVVDSDGNAYGRFTSNPYGANRTSIKALTVLLDASKGLQLDDLRDAFCD